VTRATSSLAVLQKRITQCRACPRLVAWREEVAATKKAAFSNEDYWGRPVPGFGDPDARVLIWGLAPAAHGANRTGRMFTGDQSGLWLYRALHRAGFANQPNSDHRGDGLQLKGCYITATARCAPPGNKPLPEEIANCSSFLDEELALLRNVRLVVALGKIAWDSYLAWVQRTGQPVPRPRPRFGHLARVEHGLPHVLVGSFHPSQQNTFTGKLTEPMLDAVFAWVRDAR